MAAIKRPYTATSDGKARRKRAGTEEWARQAIYASNNGFTNLGTFAVRDQKGHEGVLSVHATGRAMDLGFKDRKVAVQFLRQAIPFANELGIECVLDYFPKPFGRGWRCDRASWRRYVKRTISGAPGGRWIHVEISPQAANSVIFVKAGFLKAFGEIPPKP